MTEARRTKHEKRKEKRKEDETTKREKKNERRKEKQETKNPEVIRNHGRMGKMRNKKKNEEKK